MMKIEDAVLIVNAFYHAFQKKQSDRMAEIYHEKLKFNDPVFGDLNYSEACAMWEMLCKSSDDLAIEYEILSSKNGKVETRWHAYYSFGKEKRNVHNIVLSTMLVKEGKIISHNDEFDLYRWSKQALGLKGTLIGWTDYFKNKLNEKTRKRLDHYMAMNQ